MRILPTFLMGLFTLFTLLFFLPGCADRPEVSPQNYGTIVSELPNIAEAEAPFPFPYAGEKDHRHCEFKEDDFF
ncbi:MAG: hypothetical protein LBQ50_05725 [Planctomycetaceae bacterium]|jgi:hypothetical protein|nr:hypothetical protein [Planctomycetaceae bacterium]